LDKDFRARIMASIRSGDRELKRKEMTAKLINNLNDPEHVKKRDIFLSATFNDFINAPHQTKENSK
jgi:hypothetical protein